MRYSLRTALFLSVLLFAFGCSSDQVVSPPLPIDEGDTTIDNPPAEDLSDLRDIFALREDPAGPIFSLSHNAEWGGGVIHLPAGSVDGLAAAVAAAGPGGIVVVEAGSHVENATVLIDQRVAIFGEDGAVIASGVNSTTVASVLEPAIHVRGTEKVVLWGLDLQMTQDVGGTGILVDHSDRVSVVDCTITNAQFGILVEEGDKARMVGNTIVCTSGWLTGAVSEAHGIVVINGKGARIYGNDISNALFGLWATDLGGRVSANVFHGNFIGLILCNVPANSFPMPDGTTVGSGRPCTKWKVRNNMATGNFDAGYMVIDGSARNMLHNNNASNNGSYDIELVGDSMRFGFLTPTSVQNRVMAGHFPGLIVKDCGQENRVLGFNAVVDNDSDPCF
jgi:nitrous oxidase accessory protein NosD